MAPSTRDKNMICLGTCFQLAEVVRAGPGQPTSARCLEAIKKRWISWAGNPSSVTVAYTKEAYLHST